MLRECPERTHFAMCIALAMRAASAHKARAKVLLDKQADVCDGAPLVSAATAH